MLLAHSSNNVHEQLASDHYPRGKQTGFYNKLDLCVKVNSRLLVLTGVTHQTISCSMEPKAIDPFQTDNAGTRVLPLFSLSERDRRYSKVRALMAERPLDCLLAPATDMGEPQANSRYLCQIGGVQGGAWVVFPTSGEATAIVSAEREWRMWVANLINT